MNENIVSEDGRFLLNYVQRPTIYIDPNENAKAYIEGLSTKHQFLDLYDNGEDRFNVATRDGTVIGTTDDGVTHLYGYELRAVIADGYTPSIYSTLELAGETPYIALHMRQDAQELVWDLYKRPKRSQEEIIREAMERNGLEYKTSEQIIAESQPVKEPQPTEPARKKGFFSRFRNKK